MGIIVKTITINEPDLWNYEIEYNEDGTEKHIHLHGARFHTPFWDSHGMGCSNENCEINKKRNKL